MNRHARRAAAAKQKSQAGYRSRLAAAFTSGALRIEPGTVGHVTVLHDDDCQIDAGRCTCRPDIIRRTGSTVEIIDEEGAVEERPLS